MTVRPEVLQKQHADTKLLVMTNMLGYLEELYSFTIFMFNVNPHLSRFPTVIHSLFA